MVTSTCLERCSRYIARLEITHFLITQESKKKFQGKLKIFLTDDNENTTY